MLYAVAAYVVLGVMITFLIWRLTRTREALFAAQQSARHAETRQAAARQAAQMADQRCKQALRHLETSLARTGEALTVAGHIEVVSQQLSGLIDYITSPLDAPPGYQTGRHALPANALPQALPSGFAGEFLP